MKNIRLLSKAALVSIFIVCVSFIAKGQYDSIVHNGKNRTYLLHLPQSYTGEKTLPLVIAMHGGFGNAFGIRKMSGLSEKSDAENFIVVYPEGVKSNLDIRTWNAGWCCGFASRNNINDVGFINKLIDHLLKNYSIDSNQIYATGMSNGGLMSYRLACELSSKITAIAPVAATMTMNSCNPAKSVPLIAFHSFLDENIPYEGGTGEGASNHHNPPQDSVMQVWSNNNQCQQIADTLVNNSKYLHIKWHSCNCNSQIHHYTTHDGGHSWPGGEKTKNGDSVSKYINATDLMWSFFQKHENDCQPNSNRDFGINKKIDIFPNPTKNHIYINTFNIEKDYIIHIYNLKGKSVLKTKNKKRIHLTNNPAGLYHIKIKTHDKKIIKEKKLILK